MDDPPYKKNHHFKETMKGLASSHMRIGAAATFVPKERPTVTLNLPPPHSHNFAAAASR
jgi:hypothetical protein